MDGKKVISNFVSGWNTPDSHERTAIWERSLAEGFYYADPRVPEGIDSVSDFSDYVSQMFEGGVGMRMEQEEEADVFGRHGRFHIAMKQGGELLGKGSYCVEFSGDGRLLKAVGFVGR